MEKRKSLSRIMSSHVRQNSLTSVISGEVPAFAHHPSSPTSSTNSPVRHKSISTGGQSPTSAVSPLPLNSPGRRKPSETPCKLRKQRSAERIQIAGSLWPSAKNTGPAPAITTLRDHFNKDNKDEEEQPTPVVPTHAASTFSSRRRVSSDFPTLEDNIISRNRGSRGRLSKENHNLAGLHHLGRTRSKKKPGTPPSPSSSGPLPPPVWLSVDEDALTRRRFEFGLDFPSSESDLSETRNPSHRISQTPIKIAKVRRSGSPIRKSKSPVMRGSRSPVQHNSHSPVLLRTLPLAEGAIKAASGRRHGPDKGWSSGGMGSIISQGLGSLFRRKSFSGPSLESMESLSSISAAVIGGSSSAGGTGASVSSPVRGVVMGMTEWQHKLRMAHNQFLQWRFLNGRMVAAKNLKSAAAEKELESVWIELSELQVAVAEKRMQVAKQKLDFKVKALIYPQIKWLERWTNMEKQHAEALSSTKASFHAVVCRLPLTDHSKADPQILSILLRRATNVACAINDNLVASNAMVQGTVPVIGQLSEIVSIEKPLIEECSELLGLISNLKIQEESLQCQLMQLKS